MATGIGCVAWRGVAAAGGVCAILPSLSGGPDAVNQSPAVGPSGERSSSSPPRDDRQGCDDLGGSLPIRIIIIESNQIFFWGGGERGGVRVCNQVRFS